MDVQGRIKREATSPEVAGAALMVDAAREYARLAQEHAARAIELEVRSLLQAGFHPDSFADALGLDYARDIWPIQRELGREP